MFLDPLFKLMPDKQASDLFVTAGAPIQVKINGVVMPVNSQVLDAPTANVLPPGSRTVLACDVE